MSPNGDDNTVTAIFAAMDKLSEKPYEYWVSGIGALLVITGIFAPPWAVLTQQELWGLTGLGAIGLFLGFLTNRQKDQFKMQTNLEKIAYKKFYAEEKTRRLAITNVKNEDERMSDLESF